MKYRQCFIYIFVTSVIRPNVYSGNAVEQYVQGTLSVAGHEFLVMCVIRHFLFCLSHLFSLWIRDDNGSVGQGSRVKWVNKSEWVTWVTGQVSTRDPLTHDQVNKIPKTG